MLATVASEVPHELGWAFEPKYDGVRVLACVDSGSATLLTRNGRDKSGQFPEVVQALSILSSRVRRPFILDGEIIALTHGATPARFQELQGRLHQQNHRAIEAHARSRPAALVVFDLLLAGEQEFVTQPWTVRRRTLERLLARHTSPQLRLGETVVQDGNAMLARARAEGWEGVIAKRVDARYEPGRRSRAWRKIKIEHRQEFVVGGYTEPRNSRQHLGALLLGYFVGNRFLYAGHTGGGFTRDGLADMYRRLRPLERATSPFAETPLTNEPAHWVQPQLVVEVKFNEWTAAGKLRQPIFVGIRDDKPARAVRREGRNVQPGGPVNEGEQTTSGQRRLNRSVLSQSGGVQSRGAARRRGSAVAALHSPRGRSARGGPRTNQQPGQQET